MNRKIIRLNVIDSTHSHAIRLVTNGDLLAYTDGCAIVADVQAAGVGRCHRRWLSPKGNLFASILTRMPESEDFCKLSLAAGCAARETVLHFTGKPDFLKLHWPNDIYYKGRKICGILVALADNWLIISVGINVNVSPSIESAISIKDALESSDVSLSDVLDILLKNADYWLLQLREQNFFCVRDYWLQNINEMRDNVVIKNGRESISGIFRDLDERGRLVLERNNGERLLISSGDLFMNAEKIVVNNE
ncbi:MAG: biotin--[acetyl-CoA-carboxylase] ligase [Holosporaceae bacterium]|jgi:BirA family biotin operon repressor/biotin-[acetyl-CoA-carboxylase] ligase|nr:biotin--[acetyl-CoA-carboxylase] ligase [Holosporaceae bacterium]